MFEASSRQFMMKVVNMMIEKSIEIRGSETKANHSGLAGWRSRMELKAGARPSGSGASNGASSYRLARSVAGAEVAIAAISTLSEPKTICGEVRVKPRWIVGACMLGAKPMLADMRKVSIIPAHVSARCKGARGRAAVGEA